MDSAYISRQQRLQAEAESWGVPPSLSDPLQSITRRQEVVSLRLENDALKERLARAELAAAMAQHELGTFNLERHGWGLERERVEEEMGELARERDALKARAEALEREMKAVKEDLRTAQEQVEDERQQRTQQSVVIDVDNDPSLLRSERDAAVMSLAASRAREAELQRQITALIQNAAESPRPRSKPKPRAGSKTKTFANVGEDVTPGVISRMSTSKAVKTSRVIRSNSEEEVERSDRERTRPQRAVKRKAAAMTTGETTEEEVYVPRRLGVGSVLDGDGTIHGMIPQTRTCRKDRAIQSSDEETETPLVKPLRDARDVSGVRSAVVEPGQTTRQDVYVPAGRGSDVGATATGRAIAGWSSHQASRFTDEIHSTIASFLAGDNAYKSLAHYSAVNRSLRQTLLPTMYETVVLDDATKGLKEYWKSKAESGGGWFVTGFRHTKYIFTSRGFNDQLLTFVRNNYRHPKGNKKLLTKLFAVFPNLVFHVTWDEHVDEREERPRGREYDVMLETWRVVDSRAFHHVLRHVRIAFEGQPAEGIKSVNTVKCYFKTGIVHGNLVPSAKRFRNRNANDLELHLLQLGVRLTETMDDLLRILPREKEDNGRRVAVIFPKMRTPTYAILRKRLNNLFVDAPYPIRVEGTIHKPNPKGVSKAGYHVPKLVRALQGIWDKIPLANRVTAGAASDPLYKMVVPVTGDGLTSATFTICPFRAGEGFVVNMEAKDEEGNAVEVAKNKYPQVFYPKHGIEGDDSQPDSGSEYQLVNDSDD